MHINDDDLPLTNTFFPEVLSFLKFLSPGLVSHLGCTPVHTIAADGEAWDTRYACASVHVQCVTMEETE